MGVFAPQRTGVAEQSTCTKCYYGTSFGRDRANSFSLTATQTHTHTQSSWLQCAGDDVFIITPPTKTNRGPSLLPTNIHVYDASTQVHKPISAHVWSPLYMQHLYYDAVKNCEWSVSSASSGEISSQAWRWASPSGHINQTVWSGGRLGGSNCRTAKLKVERSGSMMHFRGCCSSSWIPFGLVSYIQA